MKEKEEQGNGIQFSKKYQINIQGSKTFEYIKTIKQ